MKVYLSAIKKYAVFKGRTSRRDYWIFTLIHFLISFIMLMTFSVFGLEYLSILFVLYILFSFLPTIAITVRRLHDIGKSGYFILVLLIPYIGIFWIFLLTIISGNEGENKYGYDPKKPFSELDQIGVNLE